MFKRYVSGLLALGAFAALGTCTPALAATSTASGFGFGSFEGALGGTQAGSHPSALTITFELNKALKNGELTSVGGEARNIEANLPPGVFGDPRAVPQCTRQQFDAEACPADTQVGVDDASLGDTGQGLFGPLEFQIYNIVPPPGVPAQFGFNLFAIQTFIDAGVRTGSDNGITVHVDNLAQRSIVLNTATFFGVVGGKAFLTLPTACGGPLKFSAEADTWEEPNTTATATPFEEPAITGCERLGFSPKITVTPDTSEADTPAGLAVDVHVPQEEGLTNPERLATSDIRDVRLSLPRGVVVDPARASGLATCQPYQDGIGTEAAPACPAASKVGSVEVSTPLLQEKLEGSVYVLQSNPPNLQLLLAVSGAGVNVKLVGDVHLDEATGQLTTTFSDAPQLPYTDLKLVFNGGPQAALVTPSACGTFTASTDFTPWATPYVQDTLSENAFSVTNGVEGTSCGSAPPFAAAMAAGTTNNQAGGFSPFSVTLSRRDQDQDLGAVTVTTPPGLLGLLKSVERCPEPQASAGTCGAGSLIGHTSVTAGPGPNPVYVQGGQVFLTGPYKGAPFGLSIVVPAVAGPFNLGNVIVRAAVSVDPHTAQITVTSDPLPTILDGVPLQIKTVNVSIDREGFMFNPTNCEPLAVGGTLTSTQGATVSVSNHFQAANCANLPFQPAFGVSTQAKTSKKDGASLIVKGSFPAGEANIHAVAVTLPKQLPARLTTIQQACPGAAFAANPAGCPAGSDIGVATASTPILAGPVTGPVYLVSHGGAAFPDVIAILQGEGVTIDLTGSIDIKHNITNSTFASVPDAPISSFTLTLPEGPHSALAAVIPAKAKGNMCGQSLTMPFTITGQNGAVLKETPKIAVTGCPKPKKKTRATQRAHGKPRPKAKR